MNHGKEGYPYKLTPTYIQFLTAIRYLYDVPCRQLEGFTRALHRLVPPLPPGDYSPQKTQSRPEPRLLPTPQGDRRTRHHRRRVHWHQGPLSRRLGGTETQQEETIREAPLRRRRENQGGGILGESPQTTCTMSRPFRGSSREPRRRIACWLGDDAYDSGMSSRCWRLEG